MTADDRRLILAALLTPFVPVALAVAFRVSTDHPSPDPVGVALYTGCIAFAAVLFMGLPAAIVLQRRGLLGWWHYGIAGGIVGMLTQLLLLSPFLLVGVISSATTFPILLDSLGNCATLGLAAGLAFWMIERPRGPRPP